MYSKTGSDPLHPLDFTHCALSHTMTTFISCLRVQFSMLLNSNLLFQPLDQTTATTGSLKPYDKPRASPLMIRLLGIRPSRLSYSTFHNRFIAFMNNEHFRYCRLSIVSITIGNTLLILLELLAVSMRCPKWYIQKSVVEWT